MIDEDRILAAMTGKPKEAEGVLRDLRERSREVAESVGAEEVDCLHLLIAMGTSASAAHQLLGACGLQLSTLRNVALSYFTASATPASRAAARAGAPAQPIVPPAASRWRAARRGAAAG